MITRFVGIVQFLEHILFQSHLFYLISCALCSLILFIIISLCFGSKLIGIYQVIIVETGVTALPLHKEQQIWKLLCTNFNLLLFYCLERKFFMSSLLFKTDPCFKQNNRKNVCHNGDEGATYKPTECGSQSAILGPYYYYSFTNTTKKKYWKPLYTPIEAYI